MREYGVRYYGGRIDASRSRHMAVREASARISRGEKNVWVVVRDVGDWRKLDEERVPTPAERRVAYALTFLDDLKHLRCEDDCEGFRNPCAACVVHDLRRRLGASAV